MAFQNFEMAFFSISSKFAHLSAQPRASQVINLSSSSSRIVTQILLVFSFCRSSSFLASEPQRITVVRIIASYIHPLLAPKHPFQPQAGKPEAWRQRTVHYRPFLCRVPLYLRRYILQSTTPRLDFICLRIDKSAKLTVSKHSCTKFYSGEA
jgi:hypothetical protein